MLLERPKAHSAEEQNHATSFYIVNESNFIHSKYLVNLKKRETKKKNLYVNLQVEIFRNRDSNVEVSLHEHFLLKTYLNEILLMYDHVIRLKPCPPGNQGKLMVDGEL